MKKSKFLLTLLCIVLVVGTVIGCSSNNNNNSNSGSSNTNSGSKGSDNNGNTDAPKEPLNASIVLTTGGSKLIANSPDINKNEYVQEFEKLANVDLDIEILPHETYNESLALLLAGGDLPDILQTKGINTTEVAPAVDAGVLLPLNELIEKHAPNIMAKVPKESWKNNRVSKDGVIYGIPQENPIRNGTVVMMRKDWLEAVGMEAPTTVEEYIEVFRAFKEKDPNGNGKADEIPFSGREKFSHTHHFFGAYDVQPGSWTWTGSELVPNFIKPEMKDALGVYRQLYEEKLFDQEVFTQPGQVWDQKITGQGVVGTWAHGAVWGDMWQQRIQNSIPDAEIVIPNAPVGPSGEPGGIYSVGSSVSDFVWTIPKSAEDKAVEIIKFFDWFYSDDAPKNFFLYGIEGKDHTVENGKVKYNYPSDDNGYAEESLHQAWLHFTGPVYHLEDEEYIKGRNLGELIMEGIKVSKEDGIIDDGKDMPALPTVKARPELAYSGLWMEYAAKVISGKEPLDSFDEFVADWKKRGGDKWIEEATEWYHNKEELAAKLPDWAQE